MSNQPPFLVPRNGRLRNRVTRCYELSGVLALNNPDWALVHGEVDMAHGGRMGHAWVEREGWVYDSVLDMTMLSADFARLYAATEYQRWPGGRAVANALVDHGHWGPWTCATGEASR